MFHRIVMFSGLHIQLPIHMWFFCLEVP